MEILSKKFDVVSGEAISNATLGDILSDKNIIFFYPKDNTPGCSVENQDFTNLKNDFEDLGIKLIGVSKDSVESHKKFIDKYSLENSLISDPDLLLHKYFGAYGEKNNYGKIVQGVIRSTFLVDKNLDVLAEWKNIRAKGHAERILKELKKA